MCFKVFRTVFRTKQPIPGASPVEQVTSTNDTDHHRQDQNDLGIGEPNTSGETGNAQEGHHAPGHDRDDRTAVDDPPDVIGPGWKTTAWNATKFTLRLVRESADAFPPLKAIAGGLCELINNFEQTASNKDSIRILTLRIQNLNESIVKRAAPQGFDENKRQERLGRNLNDVSAQLSSVLRGNSSKRFVNNVEDAQMITGLVEDIRDSLTDYQISLQQDIYDMNLEHMVSYYRSTLSQLPRAKYAGHRFGNRRPCMKGTRVELLQEIEEWASSKSRPGIYWLNGAAGTGKTTISRSLAERFFADERLGATFFFSRDDTDRKNIQLVFPTLAFQLAYQISQFRAPLVDVINRHPDVGGMSLAEQLKYLLIKPLRSLVGTPISTGPPIIIVIDALDECGDTEPVSKFLSLLSEHTGDIPFVKFFITSRPEYAIRNIFNQPLTEHHSRTLVLHDVDRAMVDRDIGIYLRSRLSAISKRSDVSIVAPWPSSDDINIIVRQCAGLFIYASTTAKFIESLLDDPRTRLQLITSMPDQSIEEVTSEIDPLYMQIMTHGFSNVKPTDYRFFERVRLIVASILFVLNPLPLSSLTELLDMRLGDIMRVLRPLHSVLFVPDDMLQPARRFHKSFPDFLTDSRRCKNPNFYVDLSIYHGKTAIHRLNLMKKSLKKNICSIPRYAMNADANDPFVRREEFIKDAVRYACLYWADHISSASKTGEYADLVLKSLKEFFGERVLLWIEVLSITENLGVAVYSIRRVEKWLVDAEVSDTEFQDLIYDCQGFVLQFFDVIRESVPHMYHSALPFLPTSSQLRKRYRHEISKEVDVLTGVDISWDACIRRIHTSNISKCVTFSPNGNLIAAASGHVVEIFDAITGVRQATLEGHSEDVKSIMFSLDNTRLISGSQDRTTKIWDLQTGGIFRTLEGHTDHVLSVSVSLDGTKIASGSEDHSVRVWDVSSGECIAILEGHSQAVDSVCWSGHSTVVSGSPDHTVNVWDVYTKTCLKLDIPKHFGQGNVNSSGETVIVYSLSFSAIFVYDVQTGVSQTIETGVHVHSVCFSPKGDQILYASYQHLYIRDLSPDDPSPTLVGSAFAAPFVCFSADGTSIASTDVISPTVKIWKNWNHKTLRCHSANVPCVCFSVDGHIAASASFDATIKVWDVTTGTCLYTIQDSPSMVGVLAVSADGMFVAWKDSYEVMIWSTDTNKIVHKMEELSGIATHIEFSLDGRQIVSVSKANMTVWDTQTGTIIAVVSSDFSSLDWVRFAGDRIIILRMDGVVKWCGFGPASTSMSVYDEDLAREPHAIPVLTPLTGPDIITNSKPITFDLVPVSGENPPLYHAIFLWNRMV